MMKYEEAVKEVEARGNNRKDPDLQDVVDVLEDLGRPDRNYEIVLIGGTNGKGSTAEFLSRILQRNGKKVGKFTSPHLRTLRERIEIDGKKISEQEFLELYEHLKDYELTFFEFITVAAYLEFSRKEIDVAVVEIGMGGRLDATNAAENSYAAITNIGLDHSQYLGDTREQIAEEKAGIIPENGAYYNGSDIDLTDEVAEERNCTEIRERETPKVEMEEFQKENLKVAVSVAEEILGKTSEIRKAVKNSKNEGRMEQVEPGMVLDGAHNPEALKKTTEYFEEGFTCVLGVSKGKDIKQMIEIIERKASKIIVTEADIHRAVDAEVLDEKIEIDSEIEKDPKTAMEKGRKEDGQTVATGSLYLIGDLKKELEEEDK